MRPYRDSRLTYITLTVFFVVVLGYALYEAQGILFGPSLSIAPQAEEAQESYIRIKGKAERITALSMNGSTIPVTEDGAFEAPYLLAPGYNRIVFDATDRYGHKTSKVVEIVYTGSPDQYIEDRAATSTTQAQGDASSSEVTASTTLLSQ